MRGRRAASVRPSILVDGALALWVEPKGKRIATAASCPTETIELALAVGLPRIAARARRRELLVETIDGDAAPAVALEPRRSLAAGARIDYRGLVVRGQIVDARRRSPSPSREERRARRRKDA